ncbi:hypothetical protein [Embleya sp. AB8]|uniref:hypothetical protein n=1 Tax=Embleya sp. AB8 TaxID=3156304 RepID=UPI003C71C9E5
MEKSTIVRSTALFCAAGICAGFLFLPSASAGVNNCGDLIICIEVPTPGGDTGGATGGSGTGGGTTTGGGNSDPGFTQGSGSHVATGGQTTSNATGGTVPQVPTDAQVAGLALGELKLRKPSIHMTPEAGRLGLVGLPVWLWIDSEDPHQWSLEGISKTVTDRGVTVTATAHSPYVTWSMGDGSKVDCYNPGKKYDPAYRTPTSPDCGYVYKRASADQPQARYTVTATVHWEASYVGSDRITHLLPDMTGETSTTVRIGELQVVN